MFHRSILSRRFGMLVIASVIANLSAGASPAHAQEPKTKIRIANSALSVTSLPLLAAHEWKLFHERGLDVEIILMSPAISVPAIVSGEIDYFAGVGPGVASASRSGLPLRAVWVSSDKVSYSLMANPKFKTVQELKGKNRRYRKFGSDQSCVADPYFWRQLDLLVDRFDSFAESPLLCLRRVE